MSPSRGCPNQQPCMNIIRLSVEYLVELARRLSCLKLCALSCNSYVVASPVVCMCSVSIVSGTFNSNSAYADAATQYTLASPEPNTTTPLSPMAAGPICAPCRKPWVGVKQQQGRNYECNLNMQSGVSYV